MYTVVVRLSQKKLWRASSDEDGAIPCLLWPVVRGEHPRNLTTAACRACDSVQSPQSGTAWGVTVEHEVGSSTWLPGFSLRAVSTR